MLQGRPGLPWRAPSSTGDYDTYRIVVSELMLQQTQVGRVIPKYEAFLQRFPTTQSLAKAALGDVLIAWQGLGYNRRAKFLWQAAQQVQREHHGVWPDTVELLKTLPGIGVNTGGAIVAYAHNLPVVFVETNIRTVLFHHFFADNTEITDKQLTALMQQLVPTEQPRDFYWAMMDYGTYLKKQGNSNLAKSKHYTKQSRFEGSVRQLRGQVLRLLSAGQLHETEIFETIEDDRIGKVLTDLEREGMIRRDGQQYQLA